MQTDTVNLDEDKDFSVDKETVKRMIEFLYEGDYRVGEERGDENASEAGVGKQKQDDIKSGPDDTKLGHPKESSLPQLTPLAPNPSIISSTETLRCHINANRIGDYYNIPGLKELANKKLQDAIDQGFAYHGFLDIILEASQSNLENDLQKILVTAAAAHIEDILGSYVHNSVPNDYTQGTVAMYGFSHASDAEQTGSKLPNKNPAPVLMNDFAFQLIKGMIEIHNRNGGGLKEEPRQAQNSHSYSGFSLEFENVLYKGEMEATNCFIQKTEAALKLLRETTCCQNSSCQAEFGGWLQRIGDWRNTNYVLRCSKCGCEN